VECAAECGSSVEVLLAPPAVELEWILAEEARFSFNFI
jgi:hypothetical protein